MVKRSLTIKSLKNSAKAVTSRRIGTSRPAGLIGDFKMIGKTISHYRILEEIGRGGMGVVYKAQDLKLDRFVALKFLPPHIGADEEEKKRFIHEAKAASALQHNNVSTIHEIDETDDSQMFICMDYYEGETLKNKIERGPLKLEDVFDIAIQAAQGLARAHEEDIIHRDIKPANLIVTKHDVVKIVDFGLAKLAGRTKLTKTGTTLGTAAYMSPEQTRGEKVDHRSDIWSLGVLLYEMITGQLPFKGDYEQAISYSIVNEEPEPMTGLRTGLPMELERIVNKALAKSPDERYQTIGDMLVDLKNLRKGFETSGVTRPVEVPRKSLKKIIIPVGAILVLVLTFFMLRSFLLEEVLSSAPVPIAVLPFENETGDEEYDRLRRMIPNLFISKLEQSKYLRVTTWERMRDLLKQIGKSDLEVEDIDKDTGFELCANDGVGAAVTGSISKLGNRFGIEVKVLDVESKEILKSAIEYGEAVESIYNLIDKLSEEISHGIGLTETKLTSIEQPVAEVTTTSIDAYNYFLRGSEEFEKLRIEEAQKFLEKAVELDSTFATAYLWLGWTYSWLRNINAGNEAYEKAMVYSQKATEKERMYIEARYAQVIEGKRVKAIRIFKQMAKKYPKEKRVHYLLALYYSGDKRIEGFKKALELDPNYGNAMNDLAYSYSEMGNFEEALEYLKRYASVSPGDPNPIDSMAEVYFKMGKLDEAIAKYKEAIEVEPDWNSGLALAYIYALKEDYSETMRWIDQYIAQQRPVGRKAGGHLMKGLYHYLLGSLELSMGEFGRAKDLYQELGNKFHIALADWSIGWVYYERGEFDLSRRYMKGSCDFWIENYPQYIHLYTARCNIDLGLLYLKEGRIDSARVKLTEAKPVLPKVETNKEWLQSRYDLFHGKVLIAENNFRDAISMLKKVPFFGIPDLAYIRQIIGFNLLFMKDVLGQAYYHSGGLDRAITEYERITQFDPDSKGRLLIYPKYHYHLAKLYEEKGLKDKAIERYEKFLDIWKDADDDLPEPHDARARLARLKGGS